MSTKTMWPRSRVRSLKSWAAGSLRRRRARSGCSIAQRRTNPAIGCEAAVYAVDVEGTVEPKAEIDEVVWVDPAALPNLPFAPLTRDHVLPLAVGHTQFGLFGQTEGE